MRLTAFCTDTYMRDLCKGPQVTVRVGIKPNIEEFFIQKDLLRSKSSLFEAAMSGPWEESNTNTVNMLEEDPEVFTVFQNWLYTSELRYETDFESPTVKDLIDLAISITLFGVRNSAEQFHDLSIDLLMKTTLGEEFLVTGAKVHRAYENTMSGAPLRLCLQDVVARRALRYRSLGKLFFAASESYPAEFVMEVFESFYEGLSRELYNLRSSAVSDFHLVMT